MRTAKEQRADEVLTIQEMARRSGFSEPTLRYYERIGLLGAVPRDPGSGHRRYDAATAERIDALACLRSSGMSVTDMRRYLEFLHEEDGRGAAKQRELFARQAERLAAEIERLRVRQEYMRSKADMWDARVRKDADAEFRAVQDIERILERF
ncbi:MerR family transcriptional regulator [Micromonospora sp. NPDC049799]|uniref:MerR family transcriptional regulator n=1 Tax=Micromonospora sp. NPDC049799 TaxID=3154741 RepID=UPI00340BD574